MANNEPSPEAFMQWLQKDRMESHITPLVEDAIKNNVPVSELIRHLSLTYSQMSGIIGCPISAHAPRQPEGNQMSAIPDHNTGATRLAPSANGHRLAGMSVSDNLMISSVTLCKMCMIQTHFGTNNVHRSTPSLGHMEGEMALHPTPAKLRQRFVFPDILVV